MVKAYLRYIQENIFGALTSNQSVVVICKLLSSIGEKPGKYLASACNEVVSLSHLHSGEV